ncbi:MAG TPA: hypothetical protein DCY20_01935 [Firmicutes bacterium]|nr:hypothetical protein [Bacillota bacterium]
MREETLKWISFGNVKPKGWLYDKMRFDLCEGYVGCLDKLVPSLIIEDDIYGKHRLSAKVKSKDVGNIKEESNQAKAIDVTVDEESIIAHNQAQYLWWNSETQSNWYDGFVRHTLLIENPSYLEKLESYIERILLSQDEDGYLGIYEPDLRYNFTTENGELWAQSTLFRGLLAYYEVTQNKKVLDAVRRAVGLTMKAYPIDESTPFYATDGFAGLSHGLTFTDTLEKLYQLTGDETYLSYAVFLFEDYNKYKTGEEDVQLKNLMNPNYRFKGHGVHTYEHLRALTIAAFASTDEWFTIGLAKYLEKLEQHVTPSGGPIGDEWIGGDMAKAGVNGYEYCSIQELLDSYSLLLQKTNDLSYADKVEWLYYNAALGAMHPREPSIAYLKSDNSYAMEGVFHEHQPHCVHNIQTRYKYSPIHQDAAVCCIPNAGRITPYFIRSMYFIKKSGLVAALFGPSSCKSVIHGVDVVIEQVTNYPSSFDVCFNISVSQSVAFDLEIRKPRWATGCDFLVIDAEVIQLADRIVIKKTWCGDETVQVIYYGSPTINKDLIGEGFISYGPLVYAKEMKSIAVETKTYPIHGFRDLHVKPLEKIPMYRIKKSMTNFQFFKQESEGYISPPLLQLMLINEDSNADEWVTLTPMANTILRRVTFPIVE